MPKRCVVPLLIGLILFLMPSIVADAANNIAINATGSSSAFDTTAIWTEVSGANLTLSTGAGNTTIRASFDSRVNFTGAMLFARIKEDGTAITQYNLSATSYPQGSAFEVSVADTEGTHYYSMDVYSTAGRKATIYRWNMSVQFMQNMDINASVNPANMNASNISSGTIPDGRLSSNVVLTSNTSYVLTDNASYVKTDNGSYVKTDNASYVKTDNTSYVKTDNTSYVKTDNTSFFKNTANGIAGLDGDGLLPDWLFSSNIPFLNGSRTFSQLNASTMNVSGVNVTEAPCSFGFGGADSYLICTDGTTVYAKNGSTGKVEYSGTDANATIMSVVNLQPNGWIHIKEGNYTVSLVLPDNVKIVGDSTKFQSKTILYNSTGLAISTVADATYNNKIHLKGLHIKSSAYANTVMDIVDPYFFTIEDSLITGSVTARKVSGATPAFVYLKNSYVQGQFDNQITDSKVENTRFSDVTSGISYNLRVASSTRVEGSYFYSNFSLPALKINGSSNNVIIVNNQFDQVGNPAIDLENTQWGSGGNTVSNNHFYQTNGTAIVIDSSLNKIIGNIFYETSKQDNGVYGDILLKATNAQEVKYNLISGNTFSNPLTTFNVNYSVYEDTHAGKESNNVIVGNTIRTNNYSTPFYDFTNWSSNTKLMTGSNGDLNGVRTKKKGVASVSNGSTIPITLVDTPTSYTVTPTQYNVSVAVTAINSSYMTIEMWYSVNGTSVSTPQNVVWSAEV